MSVSHPEIPGITCTLEGQLSLLCVGEIWDKAPKERPSSDLVVGSLHDGAAARLGNDVCHYGCSTRE